LISCLSYLNHCASANQGQTGWQKVWRHWPAMENSQRLKNLKNILPVWRWFTFPNNVKGKAM
jgi:hypothetical protein